MRAKEDYQDYNEGNGQIDFKKGDIISIWQASDHPCFGNGGKPLLRPHPFSNYDETKQEIIVINPTKKEVETIKEQCIVESESLPNLSFTEVLRNKYEIDEASNPTWPNVPVTIDLPLNWEDLPIGSDIQPTKKVIPKPINIIMKSLKLKI